jgi:nitroreductase
VEFRELIRQRYSVRDYARREVPEEVVQRVLEAFVLAPTAANRQALGLLVVSTAGRQDELRRVYPADWFASQPPLVLVACAVLETAWTRKDGKSYADVDVAIAMDHAILAATDEGLGTCWIGAFDAEEVRAACGLPDDVQVVACTPLGVPAVDPEARPRKAWDEVFSSDCYGESLQL